VTGESKAEKVYEIVTEEGNFRSYPSQPVNQQQAEQSLIWFWNGESRQKTQILFNPFAVKGKKRIKAKQYENLEIRQLSVFPACK